MSIEVAPNVVLLVKGYLLLGAVFALVFVTLLVKRVDAGAQKSSWGFRVIILPGVVWLWPLMLYRVVKGKRPPEEKNAHRLHVIQPREVERNGESTP